MLCGGDGILIRAKMGLLALTGADHDYTPHYGDMFRDGYFGTGNTGLPER